MFARAVIALLLTAILAGCGAGPWFGPTTGTVTGHVQIRSCGGAYGAGETSCPTHPYAGVTLSFALSSTAEAGRDQVVTADSSGSYRIDLKPGTYSVRASGPGDQAGALAGAREVVVAAGKTVTADFLYTIQLM